MYQKSFQKPVHKPSRGILQKMSVFERVDTEGYSDVNSAEGESDGGDLLYPTMIPEPDYCENSSQQQENNRRNIAQQQVGGVHLGLSKGSNRNKGGSSSVVMDPEGLILPRKPQNPCLDSVDRQNLHRELLFNQKIGKSVLNQKSELQRAMERQREHQARREQEQQRMSSRTPFQRVIEERAKKLEETMEKEDDKASGLSEPEFIKVHAKLRARMDSK